jgi:hypothetical protein
MGNGENGGYSCLTLVARMGGRFRREQAVQTGVFGKDGIGLGFLGTLT